MSLCHRIKRFCALLFKNFWTDKRKKDSLGSKKKEESCNGSRQLALQCATGENQAAAEVSGKHLQDGGLVSHGVTFSCQEEKETFDTKMEEMQSIFLKELMEIKRQHERLKVGRVILRRRFSELEHILQTDLKTSFTLAELKTVTEDPALSSEELQLLNEMEEILEKLEKEQEELLSLEKYLEIELRERTFYPEPVLPRHRKIEDEFSKRMKEEGGLRYKSFDETDQVITYRCLPPPLSLDQLLENNR